MGFTYLVVLLLVVGLASAGKMVDLYGRFSDFNCLAEQGYSHTVIRAYHSYGAIDTDAAKSIPLSNQAGLTTDVYMFPCRGKNATAQVNELVDYLESMTKAEHLESNKQKKHLSSSSFHPFSSDSRSSSSPSEFRTGRIWLDIEINPSSGCTWSKNTPVENCAYIKQLTTAIEKRGRDVGIYSSAYMWTDIIGRKDVCTQFNIYPIWYAHYDGKADFSDWPSSQFGGWLNPTIKQFAGDAVICNYKLDLSYF